MSLGQFQPVISNEDQCYIAIIKEFSLGENTCPTSMTAYDVVHWQTNTSTVDDNDVNDIMDTTKYIDATVNYDANYWVHMDNKIIQKLESVKHPVKTLSERLKAIQSAFHTANAAAAAPDKRTIVPGEHTIHPSVFLVNSDDEDGFA